MLKEAKKRAQRAHKAACGADALSTAIYNRWMATTLTAAAGQDEGIAAAMFTRLAIALEVMVDMKGCTAGVVQGVTA
jgi:hypothetical protein